MSFVRNVGENISKNLTNKYSQKLLDPAKQSATDANKTASKRAIEKTAETAGDLIGNKFDKNTKISNTSRQKDPETNKEEIRRERYISPEQRLNFINYLKLII